MLTVTYLVLFKSCIRFKNWQREKRLKINLNRFRSGLNLINSTASILTTLMTVTNLETISNNSLFNARIAKRSPTSGHPDETTVIYPIYRTHHLLHIWRSVKR